MNSNTPNLPLHQFPLTPGQQALWLLHRLFPNSGIYNTQFAWDIPETLDIGVLQQALEHVIECHPTLRTLYVEDEQGRPCQQVYATLPLQFIEVHAGARDDQALQQLIDGLLHQSFDLTAESMMRWYWIRRDGHADVLALAQQHIGGDLWSFMILMNDIETAYTQLQQGQPVSLQKSERTLSMFVSEQQSWLESEQAQQQAEYWRSQLVDMPEICTVPADLPRPPVRTCNKAIHEFMLPQADIDWFCQGLSEIARAPFMHFATLFHVLLYRYSGNADIVFGVPTAGRDERYDGVYGFFTNSVVLRAQCDGTLGFRDFLRQQKPVVEAGLAAQQYPFALLAQQMVDQRDPTRAPMAQICFVWENSNRFVNRDNPKVSIDESGTELWNLGAMGLWQRHSRPQQLDDFDLTLKVCKYGADYRFAIEYNTDLYSTAAATRIAGHFGQLMRSVAAQPDCPIAKLEMLLPQERQQILVQWNNTDAYYDQQELLTDRVARFAALAPDATAVEGEQLSLSYQALDAAANRLANYLVAHGVRPGQCIGVLLERSPLVIASMLGIMKAGACYLPLDPDYPSERLQYILQDAKPTFVISRPELTRLVGAPLQHTRLLDWQDPQLLDSSADVPTLRVEPEQLAYVIYTSGSTGKPKGVMINHSGLGNLMLAQRQFGITSSDRILQIASMNFDASIFEFVMALHAGATLVVAGKSSVMGTDLLQFLKNRHISWAILTPAVLAHLDPVELPELHSLAVAGDACSDTLVEKWSRGRRFYNAYGPTETTIWATLAQLDGSTAAHIGKPIANTRIYILDQHGNPQPVGVPGEMHIGGVGVAPGYLNRPDLTQEKFIPDPFASDDGAHLYKTGDLACYRDDGNIDFLGRMDHQVKIRGFRIEPGEIEAVIRGNILVHDVMVCVHEQQPAQKSLAAYVVKKASATRDDVALREYLRQKLPDYMIPSWLIWLDAFPLTPNGKIDRRALPSPRVVVQHRSENHAPRNEIERIISSVWKECLGLTSVSIQENFFDLGGHSLLLAKVYARLPAFLQEKITLVELYKYPTIQALAQFVDDQAEEDKIYIEPDEHVERMRLRRRFMASTSGVKIAIVGMAGRFPGADTVEAFWQNICDGKESITFFTPEQLRDAGVPENLIHAPNYVPAKGVLQDVAGFDAAFFNFTPREAQITDPQQRLFLECAWQALEDGGCVPEKFKGRIGVYGGVGINQYLVNHVAAHPELQAAVGDYALMLGNDKDFLCTRVSYKLNLNGPAMVVQTACSTSLVAVHTACQALLSEECDAALAGGVSLSRLDNTGYIYQEGMIMSPDGHCRAFDADAGGTVQGQGCGVVLLKRLDDALRDNDHVYAVISGSATNNDGSNKTGYTAPSVEGQSKAIRLAQASANIEPSRITYIEAHGTGTPVGDPIEIEALRQTFRGDAPVNNGKAERSRKRKWDKTCAIGSVKTNIGHLDAAAGIAGLIKTAKALETRLLPPSINFDRANPKINFDASPFYINTQLRPWETDGDKCYAAVSSFGMGGTNAHVILTQPPNETPQEMERPWRLLTLSARTPAALNAMTERLVEHLQRHPGQSFSNVCYTLHVGRALFAHRRHLICRGREDAIAELMALNPQQVITTHYRERPKKIAFLFSGQGSQYISMGKHLYQVEVTFREEVDRCRAILGKRFVQVYEELSEEDSRAQTEKLHQTFITQPSLFVFEYALAKMLMKWGVEPDFMMGHSVGEYVAACLAGVFTLDQALELVAIRGQLMQELENGSMLTVNLPQSEAELLTNHDVSLAAVNGANRCVLAGAIKAIQYLHEMLDKKGIDNRILHTSHAFHSHMMDPMLERFEAYVRRRQPQVPNKPFISSLTGDWITPEQATSARYWADHVRHTVRFHQGLTTLYSSRDEVDADQSLILLEVGPGKTLSTLARQHGLRKPQDWCLSSTRHAYEDISDTQFLLKTIGRLWEQGVDINWDAFHSQRQRYRVPLPTYPFERQRFWLEPAAVKPPPMAAIALEEWVGQEADFDGLAVESVPPRDDVETLVWRNWSDILGRSDFGVHENFFDLGGDSLMGVNLVDRLVKTFQVPLSTPILIQKPTVAELADHIQCCCGIRLTLDSDGMPVADNSPLVMIQRGSAPFAPLLMVHPIGGEVFFYRDLARHLGYQQPVYAFQAPSLTGAEPPMHSVYALAERYILEMKKAGFKPPYLLGGSSFGGLVAYEMAQQLTANDEEVRLLVMIDTPAPEQMPRNLTDSAAILQYLLQDQLNLSLDTLRQLDEAAQIDYVLDEARVQGKGSVLPPHLGLSLLSTWIAHQEATIHYQPTTCGHDVVFFRHTESMPHFPPRPHEPWMDWVEGKLEIHQVPGNHITMNYPPHVNVLAEHLRLILRKYREVARTGIAA